MKSSNVIGLAAATLITALELGAIAAIFSGEAALASDVTSPTSVELPLSDSTLAPIVVLATRTD